MFARCRGVAGMAWPRRRGRALRRTDPDRDRRSPVDRPRPQGRQAVRGFRPGWGGPHRSWQAAALARRVPVHLLPPAVIGDLVILGSSTGDNQRVDAPRGTVRAFDVRTGTPRWDWDLVPGRADDPDALSWGDGWRTTGFATSGHRIAIDEARAASCSCRPPARARISWRSSPGRQSPRRSCGRPQGVETGVMVWSLSVVR